MPTQPQFFNLKAVNMFFYLPIRPRPIIIMICLLVLGPITTIFAQQPVGDNDESQESYEIPAFFEPGNYVKVKEESIKAYAATFTENCDSTCQLIACSDFEMFANTGELRLVTTFGDDNQPNLPGPFLFDQDVTNNSPDLNANRSAFRGCGDFQNFAPSNNGGNFAHFWEKIDPDDHRTEGMAFELCRPVRPGETGIVTFEAATPNGCQVYEPRIKINFTASQPLSGQVVSINPGLQPEEYFAPVENNGSNPVEFVYVTPVLIENTTQEEWTHLIVSGAALNGDGEDGRISYYIDDLQLIINPPVIPALSLNASVDNDCLKPGETSVVSVTYELCADGPAQLDLNGQFVFPEGVSLAAGQTLPADIDFSEDQLCFNFALDFVVADRQVVGERIGLDLTLRQTGDCGSDNSTDIGTFVVIPKECESCAPCTATQSYDINAGTGLNISATNLPSPVTSDACINLSGKLIIDKIHDFVNVSINMAPGAEIVVLKETILSINESSVSACNNMWRSVTVRSGGFLEANSSTIIGGEYAFTLLPGSRARIKGNRFERNHVGIFAPGSNGGPRSQVFSEPLVGNRFSLPTDSALPPPYPGQETSPGQFPLAGIMAYDLEGFMVGKPDDPRADRNEFDRLYNGIIAYNSSTQVYGNKFSEIFSDSPNFVSGNPNGSGIFARGGSLLAESNVFDNAFTGIQGFALRFTAIKNMLKEVTQGIHAKKAVHTASIRDNDIGFHGSGIVLLKPIGDAVHFVTGNQLRSASERRGTAMKLEDRSTNGTPSVIRSNTIRIYPNSFGISIWNYEDATVRSNTIKYLAPTVVDNRRVFGIWLLNCKGARLYENEVSSSADIAFGIHGVLVGQSPETYICCSSVTGTRFGFTFRGDSYPTQISGSVMSGNYQMLRFEDNGTEAANIGEQELNYNTWAGNPVNDGPDAAHAFYAGTGNVATTSQFIVPPDCPSVQSPGIVRVNGSTQPCPGSENDWFWPDPVRRDPTVACQYDASCPDFDESGDFFEKPVPELVKAVRKAKEELFVYPNPVSGRLNVEAGSTEDRLTSLKMRDLNGKIVIRQAYDSYASAVILIVEHLPFGVYVLEARTLSGGVYYQKVVIQR